MGTDKMVMIGRHSSEDSSSYTYNPRISFQFHTPQNPNSTMPVTLHPRPDLSVNPISKYNHVVHQVDTMLYNAYPNHFRMIKDTLASTFPDEESTKDVFLNPRAGSKNGFVYAAMSAYLEHHHLIIRPEDIWFAILAQFSIYINANAESIRKLFVEHEDQKPVEVEICPGQYGAGARMLAAMIQKNVKMEGLKEWILPNWSTTTGTDKEVASVMMMGAMQKYFLYKMKKMCGLPRVTVLGEKEDYEDMLHRLDFLRGMDLGEEVGNWCMHLQPVLEGLVDSFDGETEEVSSFWNKIMDHHRNCRSGHSSMVSGWLTAFCFWDDDGKRLYSCSEQQFRAGCVHEVAIDTIPSGVVSVPVKVDVVGKGTLSCRMYAGLGGMEYKKSDASRERKVGSERGNEEMELNAVQPMSGWWMCEFDDSEAIKNGWVKRAP